MRASGASVAYAGAPEEAQGAANPVVVGLTILGLTASFVALWEGRDALLALPEYHRRWDETIVKSQLYYAAHAVQIAALLGAGLVALVTSRGAVARSSLAAFWALNAAGLLMALRGMTASDFFSTRLVGSTGPLVTLISVLAFVSASGSQRWLDRLVVWSAFALSALVSYEAATIGTVFRDVTVARLGTLLNVLYWLAAWVLLSHRSFGPSAVLRWIPLVVYVGGTVVVQTRLNVVMAASLLVAELYVATRRTGRASSAVAVLAVAAAVVAVLPAVLELTRLDRLLGDALAAFRGRMFEDSRSNQLIEFFTSVAPWELVLGRGSLATWNWPGMSPTWTGGTDVGYLSLLFYGGAPLLVTYVAFHLVPAWRIARRSGADPALAPAAIALLWALRMFSSSFPSLTPDYYVVLLCVGRCIVPGTRREQVVRDGLEPVAPPPAFARSREALGALATPLPEKERREHLLYTSPELPAAPSAAGESEARRRQSAPALRVGVVTATLPRAGNITGSPAHVLKTVAAVSALGADVRTLELDTQRVQLPHRLLGAMWRTFRFVRDARPHVLHVHGHIAAAVVLPAARILRVPVVLEVHGVYRPSSAGAGTRPVLSRLAGALELPVLRRADHLIVQASAMRDRLVAAGVPNERITVVYPGVRTAEFSEYAGPSAEVAGSGPWVVYVGSTQAFQGLDLLAASQRLLPEAHRVVLVLSGERSAPEDVVRRFGFDAGRTTVVHPESAAALPAWTRRADVLVHARPDVPDNVNVQSKLGLYLASGRPVVATDVGDYRTLLGAAAGCVLAPPVADAIARAIVRAVCDPAVREAAATENPVLARRHFEASVNAARVVEVYRACASRHRREP